MHYSPYKRIRNVLGLRQEDVAQACGVNKKTVARFESGEGHNAKVKEWYEEAAKEVILKLNK